MLGRGLCKALLPYPPAGQFSLFRSSGGLEQMISAFGVSVVQLQKENYQDSTHPPGEVVRCWGVPPFHQAEAQLGGVGHRHLLEVFLRAGTPLPSGLSMLPLAQG